MVDVAEVLTAHGIPYAVIGAMAAAVHGVVRASLDADAVISTHLAVARDLQREFAEKGYGAELRTGDVDDPIRALLMITDPFANRVDLLIDLRGMDPALDSIAKLPSQLVRFIGGRSYASRVSRSGVCRRSMGLATMIPKPQTRARFPSPDSLRRSDLIKIKASLAD